MFTKLFSTALLTGLLISGINARAQTTFASAETMNTKDAPKAAATTTTTVAPAKQADPVDTSFHPVRRLWGYTFGDFYYAASADPANRGAETNYNGVPKYRNAFQFRRVYLGYDYDITKKFSAELLLEAAPGANTNAAAGTSISNGDNLADNKMSFYIKLINLRYKGIWDGTDFVFGQVSTPGFALLSEKIWGYRSIEKTVADFHKTNSFDIGAALQGVFDVKTKNFGYDLMIGDNTSASVLPATVGNGFFKAFYGDVYGKFLDKKLILDIYADYMKTTITSGIVGPQSHNMIKGFAAYTTPQLTVGVEAYTNKFKNAVTATDGTTKTVKDATAQAISIFAHGQINKDKLGWFARYDGYQPNTNFNTDEALNATPISSYNLFTKQRFVTAGLDLSPAKNVHFMPNVWFVQYKDERDPGTTGYVPDGHSLVYRLTVYFTFGK